MQPVHSTKGTQLDPFLYNSAKAIPEDTVKMSKEGDGHGGDLERHSSVLKEEEVLPEKQKGEEEVKMEEVKLVEEKEVVELEMEREKEVEVEKGIDPWSYNHGRLPCWWLLIFFYFFSIFI